MLKVNFYFPYGRIPFCFFFLGSVRKFKSEHAPECTKLSWVLDFTSDLPSMAEPCGLRLSSVGTRGGTAHDSKNALITVSYILATSSNALVTSFEDLGWTKRWNVGLVEGDMAQLKSSQIIVQMKMAL